MARDPATIGLMMSVCNDLSTASSALMRLSDDINVGLKLIEDISSCYRPKDKIGQDVKDYLVEFQDLNETFGTEGLADAIIATGETAIDIIKAIVRTLWEWLCKLWDGVVHCFKYMGSSRYRCAQQFNSIKGDIAQLAKHPEWDEEFKRYQVDQFVSVDDMKEVLKSLDKVYDILVKLADNIDANMEDPDKFVTEAGAQCGISREDGRYFDTFTSIKYKSGTLGSLGWSCNIAVEMNEKLIEVSSRKASIDKAVKRLEDTIKRLRAEIKPDGSSKRSRDLKDVQNELQQKNAFLSIIRMILVVYTNRLVGLARMMTALAEVSKDIAKKDYDS